MENGYETELEYHQNPLMLENKDFRNLKLTDFGISSLQQIRGCLGTTWKKQLDLLKMDIISKTTAPYETRHHMEQCIKALCNPDVTMRFKIGRDVSLLECYVRSARNPLRDLGGKLASDRHNFAFYARNMHWYLRKILLEYRDNKDADMKIMGPML
ncbi:probable glycosyltransferase [Tanacetum coccineum]